MNLRTNELRAPRHSILSMVVHNLPFAAAGGAVLWLAATPVPALAARQTVNGIEWNYYIENGGAVVGLPVSEDGDIWSERAIPASTRGAVTIPSTLGGRPVRKIGPSAFQSCAGITSISIPSTVEAIENGAFFQCSSLASVTIPAGVSEIADDAFNWCDSLSSFSVASGNGTYRIRNGMLYRGSDTLVRCPPAKSGAVTVPSGTTTIDENAFAGCFRMTSVSLPEGLRTIDWDAFWRCSALTSISLPASLESYFQAFEGCTSLASFSVASGSASFQAKDGVLFSKDGAKLLRYPPAKNGTSYAIPSGTTVVDSDAFIGASKLVSLSFPASVASTDAYNDEFYLYGCTSLSTVSVDLSNPVFKSVGGVLFSKDGKRLVSFPPGKSGAYPIPAGTETVDFNAFEGCSRVTSLTIPSSLRCEGDMFSFYDCSSLSSFYVDPDNATFRATTDGVLFRGSTLLAYPPGRGGSYSVPYGTYTIGEDAFATAAITGVSIPSSVSTIGALAFYGCESLSSVSLASGLQTIFGQAFQGCKTLRALSIPSSVTAVDSNAFLDSGLSSVSASATLRASPWPGVSGSFETWTGLGSVTSGGGGGGGATTAMLVFLPNGGSVDTGSKTVAAGDKAGTIPLPVRDGWRFEGWWTDPDDGGDRFCAATVVPAGTTTLYARWSEPDEGDCLPVYRFYSKNYKGHFFTIDLEERNTLYCGNPNWNYEGVAYYAFAGSGVSGTTALYRFYSKKYRGHFFTIDEEEMRTVRDTNPNWRYEGIAYYVYPEEVAGSVPVFRFWSKGYRHHFYTTDEAEKDDLIANNPNWKYECVAFWALPDEAIDGGGSDGAVEGEAVAETTTSRTMQFMLAHGNVVPGSLALFLDGVRAFADNGDGTLTSIGISAAGTVNYASGAVQVTFNSAAVAGRRVTASYRYFAASAAVFGRQAAAGRGRSATSAAFSAADAAERSAVQCAPWTLAADGAVVAVSGVTDVGGAIVETRGEAPDADELEAGGAGIPDAGEIALRLTLPGGAFDSSLWSAAEGALAERKAEGAFDFALPVSGVWHWLRVRDAEGEGDSSDAFSVWIRAE